MLKQVARFLAPFGETATAFEGYYQRLLGTDAQAALTADEARRDYRQALQIHNWLR